jgi:hypothetical protein
MPEKDNCNKLMIDELLENDQNITHQITLARCNCLMDRYLRWKKRNHQYSDIAQGVALVFTAITPVVLLMGDGNGDVRILGAATAAIATVATGLLNFTGWRDNYIRYGYTWHRLQSEKYRYLTSYGSCSDKEKAAREFAERIEKLVMAEVADWRAEMERTEQEGRASSLDRQE